MKLVFPGSFDPITKGHVNIIERALTFADEVHVVVMMNPKKSYAFTLEERLSFVKAALLRHPEVRIDSWDGLCVDYCRKVGATAILRGLRTTADLLYEMDLAAVNKNLSGIETLYLQSEGPNIVSAKLVREMMSVGADYKAYIPSEVYRLIKK